MSLIEFFLQPGYPRANNGISLVAMLNLSGGVLPKTYGGGSSTRGINLLLKVLNDYH